MKALATVATKEDALEVFTGDKFDEFLTKTKEDYLSIVADVSTAKGRKEIASSAFRVSKLKVALSDAKKSLTAEWNAKLKLVNKSGKKSDDFLAELRDEVRLPLTEWEDEEKLRSKMEALKSEWIAAYDEAIPMNDLFNREIAIAEKERLAAEKEAEELQLKEEAQAESDKLERERLMKEQAAEQATLQAERDAQAEIDKAKRLEAEAIAETEKVKREAIEAENAAQEAAEQAETARVKAIDDARIAQENAVIEAQEAARLEADRFEQDRLNVMAEEKRIADIKAANKEHRRKVNCNAVKCFVKVGIDAQLARNIVTAIAEGKIDGITINY